MAISRNVRLVSAQPDPVYKPKKAAGTTMVRWVTPRYGDTDTAIGDGFTFHVCAATESHFDAVRLVLFNSRDVTVDVASCAAAVTNSSATNSTRDATGSWVPITFNGSTSVTLPVRYSQYSPSITKSDWVQLNSIDRIDANGVLPLVMFRCYVPATTTDYGFAGADDLSSLANDATNSSVLRRVWYSYRQQVDGITTPSNFTSTTAQTGNFITCFEYITRRVGINVMGIGDSITLGFGGTPTTAGGWGHKLCTALSTVDRPVSWVCSGYYAQQSYLFGLRAMNVLDNFTPDILFYSPFSPNDGTPDNNTVAKCRYWMGRVLDKCRENGIFPILTTPCPNTASGWNASADAARLALKAHILEVAQKSNIPVVDFDAILSDGATPARFQASLTTDNIHPNNAGYIAMGAAAQIPVANYLANI